ncbi:hypothetical protein AB0I37_14270 [Micromonospora purpureochromogenes]|uniref:hypothetical protein n=1 Tax=Micromonospora purpureochromogenes TaxID=47872 RepID=UPI0034105E5C
MTLTDDEHRRRQLAQSVQADGWFALTADVADCLALARAEVDPRGRRQITALMLVGDPIDSTTLKRFPIGLITTTVNMVPPSGIDPDVMEPLAAAARKALASASAEAAEPVPSGRPRLTRPDGTDPEGFYKAVADAYREAVAQSRAVAPTLADEAGVPIPTVHRWIGEARRRGFLPPARKGRAG